MTDLRNVPGGNVDTAQAEELALLVDLEARWENLRTTSQSVQVPPTTQNLHDKQKAYEAFSVKLAEYNKRYVPAHVPELLLNTPARLGIWCRTMRKLYSRVENIPRAHCPAHLLEKAYRWADRVASKRSSGPVNRATPPASIAAAIRDLEALGQWCDDLTKAAVA